MKGKRRTSVWVDPQLVLLMQNQGIDISSFLNRAMALFLDLPEDPREKLIREKSEKLVHKLLCSYNTDLKESLAEAQRKEAELHPEKLRELALQKQLFHIGDCLKETSVYGKLLKSLMKKNPDIAPWEIALKEINSSNGNKYSEVELWNLSLDWYKNIGSKKPGEVQG